METKSSNDVTRSCRENSLCETKRTSFKEDGKRDSFKSLRSSFDGSNDAVPVGGGQASPKVPRKFITNWKQACDRTRDRTKELIKRWRTLPESEQGEEQNPGSGECSEKEHGWSVHVWSTWVRRAPSDDEEGGSRLRAAQNCLSQLQKAKFAHFFSHLVDWDRDDLISEQDFENLTERLRHFADWSTNSPEYHVLREVQQGFVETFITAAASNPNSPDENGCGCANMRGLVSLEQWLVQWSLLVAGARNMHDFPLWLQYFGKVIFLVINRSGSGIISRDELRDFYSSFLGFNAQQVGEVLDLAYNNMTSSGDHQLVYRIYHLCFANFLLGRNPHGPGQFLFGPLEGATPFTSMFPIDYSAFNCPPESLEQYSPHKKSNRHSVIV